MAKLALALFLFLFIAVNGSRHATVRRAVSDLRNSYDFIIAGGGTSGLTVADRLSEAFPNRTVLVVEYGDIEYAPGDFDPPQIVWGAAGHKASSFNFTSLPLPDLNNRSVSLQVGKVVGGSSAINDMAFDRGSRYDFDAFNEISGAASNETYEQWNWDAIYPFFKKSVTFTPPSPAVAAKYEYTWNLSAYGGSTPIYSTLPPFQWADHHLARDAWKEMGIWLSEECAGGDKEGLCWMPLSENPITARRSHAGVGHYAVIHDNRTNYDLLVKHQVVKLHYPRGVQSGPPVVEIRSLECGLQSNITAKLEVILSAGALHTPTILQRSGIGPSGALTSAGINTLVDLPGVGSNLQDHNCPPISWNYTKSLDLSPLPPMMLNETYAAAAVAAFDETPAQGPYTLAMSNSAIFVPLTNITIDYMDIINRIREMVADGSASAYLPPDYRLNTKMVAGYKHQLTILSRMLSSPKVPSIESLFATGTGARALLLHPLSRGTVRLNLTDHLELPVLDTRTASNPVDFDLHLAHIRYLRRMVNTTSLQAYGAVEVAPGTSVQSDDDLLEYIKRNMILTYYHPCCTAAMMPEEEGGVVTPELKVYGTDGLRVVDMSVIPFLPSSHLSSTAYAIGEKAAHMIIREWSGQ